jgi:phosphoenolpyruvate-protein kinase (PTS system EI component)
LQGYGDFWLLPNNLDENSPQYYEATEEARTEAEVQYEFEDDESMEENHVELETGEEMLLSDDEIEDEVLAEIQNDSMSDSDSE